MYPRVHLAQGLFAVDNCERLHSKCSFFAGLSLLPPLFMARRVLSWGSAASGFPCDVAAGCIRRNGDEIFLIPYYVAPFTAAIYAVGLQMMRTP